ncbi:MAG: hypothetical protein GWN32_01075 [Gemmatimonadetes bacterium]|nr:hypothetical protein [Gemmatimonadota bacterium]
MTENNHNWPVAGPEGKTDREAWKKLVNDMHYWARDLERWGKRVRRDIVTLETQLDYVVDNPGKSPEDYKKQFKAIAEKKHEELGPDEPFKPRDPEDPPPPPWDPK